MIDALRDAWGSAFPLFLTLVFLLASFLTGHVAGIHFEELRDAYAVIVTDGGPKVVAER